MYDLHDELKALVDALNEAEVGYALCGGLAMAIFGRETPTRDIDLLVEPERVDAFRRAVGGLGFTIEVQPVYFHDGAVQIRKFIKRDRQAMANISIKALVVTPDLGRVWSRRECIPWEERRLCMVSKWGMIELKTMRRNRQDLEDIAWLRTDT